MTRWEKSFICAYVTCRFELQDPRRGGRRFKSTSKVAVHRLLLLLLLLKIVVSRPVTRARA